MTSEVSGDQPGLLPGISEALISITPGEQRDAYLRVKSNRATGRDLDGETSAAYLTLLQLARWSVLEAVQKGVTITPTEFARLEGVAERIVHTLIELAETRPDQPPTLPGE